jgi:predicted peptidase
MSTNSIGKEGSGNSQTAHHFNYRHEEVLDLDYLLYLPKDFDAGSGPKAGRKFPLMLFLHGAGERGTNIWKVAVHGPPKNVSNHQEYPFIIVSPQCPEHQIWTKEMLLPLLDKIIAQYPVDTSQVYLTGLSMGGFGTWDLGLSHPERFAAIAPICGGGQPLSVLLAAREKAEAIKTLGIWAFHGAKDPVVPVEESQRMIGAVKKAGASAGRLVHPAHLCLAVPKSARCSDGEGSLLFV